MDQFLEQVLTILKCRSQQRVTIQLLLRLQRTSTMESQCLGINELQKTSRAGSGKRESVMCVIPVRTGSIGECCLLIRYRFTLAVYPLSIRNKSKLNQSPLTYSIVCSCNSAGLSVYVQSYPYNFFHLKKSVA